MTRTLPNLQDIPSDEHQKPEISTPVLWTALKTDYINHKTKAKLEPIKYEVYLNSYIHCGYKNMSTWDM